MNLQHELFKATVAECMWKLAQVGKLSKTIEHLNKALDVFCMELPIVLEPIERGSNEYGLFVTSPYAFKEVFEKLKTVGFTILTKDSLHVCPMRCNQYVDRVQITFEERHEEKQTPKTPV